MDAGKKPYIVAVVIQLIYTGMFVVSKAAFNQGMSTYVFIFYRQAAGSVLLLPLALLLQRKNARSMLSFSFLMKLFLYALIGITFSVNLYHVSLKFTSATVASATDNSLPAVTFFLALPLRMEVVNLKSPSGIAKLTGVALCLAGVCTIALYVGPSLNPVSHPRSWGSNGNLASCGGGGAAWIKWTFLMVVANAGWSLWIVLQAALLREYPNKLLVTAAQCVFSAAQSLVVAAVAERDLTRWKLRLDVSLLAVVYSGLMVMGVTYYLQAWVMEMRGPVFLAAWTPLCFVFTTVCSFFFLGETVRLGSVLGGVLLVGGLYSVLWGKSKDGEMDGNGVAPRGQMNIGAAMQHGQEQPEKSAGEVPSSTKYVEEEQEQGGAGQVTWGGSRAMQYLN